MENKNKAELNYWKSKYQEEGKDAFNKEKSLKDNIFKRYCESLNINSDSFRGKIILDVGCGPRGSLHYFNAKAKLGIDPLANEYQKEFNVSKQNMIYLKCKSENIALTDNSVDVVISLNALDHVDDFDQTLKEIHRILKPSGEIRFEINLRSEATSTEPITLDEVKLKKSFANKFEYNVIKTIKPVGKTYKIITIIGRKI